MVGIEEVTRKVVLRQHNKFKLGLDVFTGVSVTSLNPKNFMFR